MRRQWYNSDTWNMILLLHEWSYWLQRTCFAANTVTLLCSNCICAAVCQGHMWLPESCIALCCGNLISNLVLLICIMNKVIQHKRVYGKSGSFSSSRVFYVEATLCIMFLFNLSPSQIYDNSCRGETSNLQVRFDGDRTGWVHLLSCKPLLLSGFFQEREIHAGQLHCKFWTYSFQRMMTQVISIGQ